MQLEKKYLKALEFMYYRAYNKGRIDEKRGNDTKSNDEHFKSSINDIERLITKGELFS